MSFRETLEDLQNRIEGISDGRVVDAWLNTQIHERSDGTVLIIRIDRASDAGLASLLRTLYEGEDREYWISGMKPADPYDDHAFEVFVGEHPAPENVPNEFENTEDN